MGAPHDRPHDGGPDDQPQTHDMPGVSSPADRFVGPPIMGPPPMVGHSPARGFCSWPSLVVGAAVGLVVGAGALGLAWEASSNGGDGAAGDAASVCDLIARTEKFTYDDTTSAEAWYRLSGIAEIGPSMAKADPRYKPLADELERASYSTRAADLEGLNDSLDKINQICASL